MTFAELATEFYARGFDYLETEGTSGQNRAKRWLNQSYLELVEAAPWPFAEVTTTGTAPLTVSDIRSILSITNSTTHTNLDLLDRREVARSGVDLTTTGTGSFAYLEGNVLMVYPANTSDTLTVRYLEVPDELAADADEPVIPDRFQDLIIDGAVIKALKDSDNYEAVAALRQEYDRAFQAMVSSLLDRSHGNTDVVTATDGVYWRGA